MTGRLDTSLPMTGAKSDVADADYLHYGFWLMKTTDEDGVLTYNEVETFAGSSIDFRPGRTSMLSRAPRAMTAAPRRRVCEERVRRSEGEDRSRPPPATSIGGC